MFSINRDLLRAIAEKRVIEFRYKHGPARLVEPHDYGVQHGVERLLAFQVGGYSRSGPPHGWRHFDVADMGDLHVLDQTFPGSRTDASQHHTEWERLFARVS